MPRGPHPRGGRPRAEPVLDHVIQLSIDGVDGFDPDTGRYKEVVLNGLADATHATEIRRALYRSAKHMKVSLHSAIEKSPDGGHQIRFTAIDKAAGRRYMNSIPAHKRSYNQHIPEV